MWKVEIVEAQTVRRSLIKTPCFAFRIVINLRGDIRQNYVSENSLKGQVPNDMGLMYSKHARSTGFLIQGSSPPRSGVQKMTNELKWEKQSSKRKSNLENWKHKIFTECYTKATPSHWTMFTERVLSAEWRLGQPKWARFRNPSGLKNDPFHPIPVQVIVKSLWSL